MLVGIAASRAALPVTFFYHRGDEGASRAERQRRRDATGQMTQFSVVIPAFNQRERLLDAVESVERQSLPAHEIIVVDDGSSDSSAVATTERYPDVRVVTQPNLGKGIARNHGASVATGEWLCFLDHDDLWHPDKLRSLCERIEQCPDVIAIDHGVWIFKENEADPGTAWSLEVDFVARTLDEALERMEEAGSPRNDFSYLERSHDSFEASLRRVFSTTSALSIRRDAFFRAGGFNPAHANGEDWALSVNVARLGDWQTIPRALSCQRFLPTSDSGDPASVVMILATLVNHWYSGRPLRERTRGFAFLDELRKYTPENRRLAQSAIWGCVRRRELRGAGSALWLSMLLLPRWRDRIFALTPPPVAWRIEHGRLRGRPASREVESLQRLASEDEEKVALSPTPRP